MKIKFIAIFLFTSLLLGISLFGCSGGQPACNQPLDEEVINRLLISPEQDGGIKPGDNLQLELAYVECCTFYETVNACATWELETGSGASITPAGELTVASDAVHGEQLKVIANVEDGRQTVVETFLVYRGDANPLVGTWEEISQISCDSHSIIEPSEPIQEVIFKADGTFVITKQPFELYYDYKGIYSFDLAANNIELMETGGNRSPSDFDGQGSFRIEADGTLVLESIWLGLRDEATPRVSCGHRLVKK